MAPENNPADDRELTREEWEAYERERENARADRPPPDDSDIEES